MGGAAERLILVERLLDEVRLAERRMAADTGGYAWRGPARTAFDRARDELPVSLRSAAEALERERIRAVLAVLADRVQ